MLNSGTQFYEQEVAYRKNGAWQKKRKQEVERTLSNGDTLPMNFINFNTNLLLRRSLSTERKHKHSW